MEEKFEAIKDFLGKIPSQFLIVYCRKPGLLGRIGSKLKWCKAACPELKTREELNQLALGYLELATYYYHRKEDRVEEELHIPANAAGNRWWLVVIGSGALRAAGYSLVTRVAAKVEAEVRQSISTINEIVTDK